MSQTKIYKSRSQTAGDLQQPGMNDGLTGDPSKKSVRNPGRDTQSQSPKALFDRQDESYSAPAGLSAEQLYFREVAASSMLSPASQKELSEALLNGREHLLETLCCVPAVVRQIAAVYRLVTWSNMRDFVWRLGAEEPDDSDVAEADIQSDEASDGTEEQVSNSPDETGKDTAITTDCIHIAVICERLYAQQTNFYLKGGRFEKRPFKDEEIKLGKILAQGVRLQDRRIIEMCEHLETGVIRLRVSKTSNVPVSARSAFDFANLTEEKLATILTAAKTGLRVLNRHKTKMFESNTRLVIKIARTYARRGVANLDLIQEGNIGLMKAIELFDPERGTQLSTYAAFWIRAGIKRAIHNTGSTIRIPVHEMEFTVHVQRFQKRMQAKTGVAPTAEEIFASIGKTLRRVQRALAVPLEPVSLATPIGDKDGSELGDLLPDRHSPSPEALTLQGLLRQTMSEVLGRLNPREERILRLRFGIGVQGDHTLEQVGQMFNLTRERIRQIEAKALTKLKHPRYARKLKDYHDPTL